MEGGWKRWWEGGGCGIRGWNRVVGRVEAREEDVVREGNMCREVVVGWEG